MQEISGIAVLIEEVEKVEMVEIEHEAVAKHGLHVDDNDEIEPIDDKW